MTMENQPSINHRWFSVRRLKTPVIELYQFPSLINGGLLGWKLLLLELFQWGAKHLQTNSPEHSHFFVALRKRNAALPLGTTHPGSWDHFGGPLGEGVHPGDSDCNTVNPKKNETYFQHGRLMIFSCEFQHFQAFGIFAGLLYMMKSEGSWVWSRRNHEISDHQMHLYIYTYITIFKFCAVYLRLSEEIAFQTAICYQHLRPLTTSPVIHHIS